ncbi:EI24 domain-containing protein [Microbacterium paludicola]|uniref:EI24 domain-containing protein n=1 Tax=Microbacterium paludicola TaxID=300019 RepID=UPI00119EBBF8|nr:EI24 domain-containing protein [Microbacterium paludicola]
MIREFVVGAATLLRGFRMWTTHTRLMALGLIPAFIAWLLLLAALVPLVLWLVPITEWMTPFADGWSMPWQGLMRFGVGAVVVIAGLALSAAVFTALTLTIGDPFYQRIWRGVERSLGEEPTGETGFWTTLGEGVRLVVLGILVALLTLVIGFLPILGGIAASVIGVLLNGRLLARELTGRAFDARGLHGYSRSAVLRAGRARVIGFGVATQLLFLTPFGAIVTMPAAVAGSTLLAHDLLRRTTPVSPGTGSSQPAPPPPVAPPPTTTPPPHA